MGEAIGDGGDQSSRRGREAAVHLAGGLGFAVAAMLVSAMIARRGRSLTDSEERPAEPRGAPFHTPRAVFGMVWPPIYLALTLSGLRVWNAPASAARTRALTLWTVIQGLNAVLMALGPRRLGGRLTAAAASVGTALAYAWEAHNIEAPSSALASPYLGWIGMANVLGEEFWRRARPSATIH